jgi:hypothetical protein
MLLEACEADFAHSRATLPCLRASTGEVRALSARTAFFDQTQAAFAPTSSGCLLLA